MNQNISTKNEVKTTPKNISIRRLALIPAVFLLLAIPVLLLMGNMKDPAKLSQRLPLESSAAAAYPQLFPPEGPFDYPAEGEQIGSLSISSIGFDAQIIEGTVKTLPETAAVHPAKSPLPGENARVLIDAEGSFSMKAVSRANPGDEVIFRTYYGTYIYRVEEAFRFHMDDASYRENGDTEELLLYVSAGESKAYYAILCRLSDGKAVQWK